MKDSFIIYCSQYDAIKGLTDEQLGKLLRALFEYGSTWEEPPISDPFVKIAFGFIRIKMDLDKRKYDAACERNKANGRKGGNPNFRKGHTNPYYNKEITEDNPTLPKITEDNPTLPYNDSDKDKERDNDTNDSNIKDTNVSMSETSSDKQFKMPNKIDVEALRLSFNKAMDENGAAIPRCTRISDQRKQMLLQRCKEYGVEQVVLAFQKAARSDFLNGGNGFMADFTWIVRPNNFCKVLEGKYDNRINDKLQANGIYKRENKDRRGSLKVEASSAEEYKGAF